MNPGELTGTLQSNEGIVPSQDGVETFRRRNMGSRDKKQMPGSGIPALQSENLRIFVDGYNVIGTDPVLDHLKAQGLEIARETLRRDCNHYVSRHPSHILFIVFDGDSSIIALPEKTTGQFLNERRAVREVFTETGQSADQWILQMASDFLPDNGVVIVSDDTELVTEGAIKGLSRIPCEVFLKECRRSVKRQSAGSGRNRHFVEAGKPIRNSRMITDELKEKFSDSLDEPVTL